MDLKTYRKIKNVSQLKVCKDIGISQAYYSKIETENRVPMVSMAKKIAAYFGFDWKLFYEDEKSTA